jgi:hypothetical protein
MADPNTPRDGEVSIVKNYGEEKDEGGKPHRTGALEDIRHTVKEFASRLPDQIGRAVETAQSAIRDRVAERGHYITVQVDDFTQARIDVLVEAGLFANRSDSAAFLIAEGIKARGDVFDKIASKISEIERLRSEMRAMVAPEDTPGSSNITNSGGTIER